MQRMPKPWLAGHRKGKPRRALLIAVFVHILLFGPTIGVQGHSTAIHIGITWDPETQPGFGRLPFTDVVASHVFQPLLQWSESPDGDLLSIKGLLVRNWSISSNGKEYTFRLDQRFRLSSDAPLTSEDVVSSLNAQTQKDATGGVINRGKAERIDDWTFVIRLPEPFPSLLPNLAHFRMSSRRGLGTGPFRIQDSGPDRVELRINPHFLGPRPTIDRIVFHRVTEESAPSFLRQNALQVVLGVDPSLARQFEGTGQRIVRVTSPTLVYLQPNLNSDPFSERSARAAVAMALNTKQIVDRVYGKLGGDTAANPFLPYLPVYNPRLPSIRFNSSAAKLQLAKLGYSNGLHASLAYVDSLANGDILARSVQNQLSRVGIKVRLFRTSEKRLAEKPRIFDMVLAQASNASLDPFWEVDRFSSTSKDNPMGYTFDLYRWARPSVALTLEERLRLYSQIQIRIWEQVPWIPLYYVSHAVVVRRSVQGLEFLRDGTPIFTRVIVKRR